jgi:hypothetical protein
MDVGITNHTDDGMSVAGDSKSEGSRSQTCGQLLFL